MAEAESKLLPGGEGDEGQAPKKSKLKKLIMLLLILTILGGGGFAAWTFFVKDWLFGEAAPVESTIPAESLAATPSDQPALDKDGNPLPPPLAPAPGLVLTMEPFMVNLADTNARRFLRIIVAIDVENDDMRKEVEARMPRIRDSLLLLFGSKTSHDLTGAQGKLRLRMEILKVVNNVLGVADKITQAYYQEFVVQ